MLVHVTDYSTGETCCNLQGYKRMDHTDKTDARDHAKAGTQRLLIF